MKLDRARARHFHFRGINGIALSSAEDCAAGDVAILRVDGRHGRLKSVTGDRFYFVIHGAGRFEVGGINYNVSEDDLVFVPRNTAYDFEGNMKIAVFCAPAFDPAGDVDLEK